MAGSTLPGSSNGQGNLASFNRPLGLFIDRNNNIYVADHENSSIRKLTPSGFVSTVYQFTLGMNSPKPNGITQDSEGNFYVTFTSGNSGVKKIIVEKINYTLKI
ncbi:MAG: hypothetical protein IPL24_11690 [Bacteroidetes bacterium]|nr:hypothetical protein [Bacteroidota bacterium]